MYHSYGYLEDGKDLRTFRFPPQLRRVPSQGVPVTEDQEARVHALMNQYVMISLHDHPTLVPEDIFELPDLIRQGRDFTGYEGLRASGLHVVFDNMLDGTSMITSHHGWKWDDVLYDLGMRFSDLAHQNTVRVIRRYHDIAAVKAAGQVGLVFAVEGGAPIEHELDRVDILYGFGVRMMGLVYSESNALGSGLKEVRDGGLTQFGRAVVRRMNQLGMAIDVSHTGDRTALDAIACSDVPVFVTHAGARALWDTPRMKPDAVIQAIADKGGVFGIEAAPHTTLTAEYPRHCLDGVMQHFEYVANLVGLEHVAFGPDTLFGDHAGLHQVFAQAMSLDTAQAGLSFPTVPYVDGLENPAEFPNIIRWLVVHGYRDADIAAVAGGNILRVLAQVWGEEGTTGLCRDN
ncbi:MAG: diguanylate cyclase [Sulfobacillus acidophilus]|uniref:Diguanylate cyclase n=1 Tax=Sulfobacillus acidophilus TaxID=53633 RepID=A0A2T2WFP2_9FIRM|nr:MAG: diguanylate cyclase [Sulfobacillus acidophilus]